MKAFTTILILILFSHSSHGTGCFGPVEELIKEEHVGKTLAQTTDSTEISVLNYEHDGPKAVVWIRNLLIEGLGDRSFRSNEIDTTAVDPENLVESLRQSLDRVEVETYELTYELVFYDDCYDEEPGSLRTAKRFDFARIFQDQKHIFWTPYRR